MNDALSLNPIRFSGGPTIIAVESAEISSEEYLKTYGGFIGYVSNVWVNENPVPIEPPDLAAFDVGAMLPEYHAYLASGRQPTMHGITAEEAWLSLQLFLRGPITFLFNLAQPEQPLSRISRLRKITADGIWSELIELFANREMEQYESDVEPGAIVLVYDGDKIAHAIAAFSIQDNELHFFDPWPGHSLLCKENNSARVEARTSQLRDHAWCINADEFRRVVFSALPIPHSVLVERKHLRSEEKKRREEEKVDFNYSFTTALNYIILHDPRMAERGVKPFSRLEAAAMSGHLGRLNDAVLEGNDVNEVGNNGPPLNLAAKFGHVEAVRLLIDLGADPKLLDATGKTAEQAAQELGNIDIAKYLRELRYA